MRLSEIVTKLEEIWDNLQPENESEWKTLAAPQIRQFLKDNNMQGKGRTGLAMNLLRIVYRAESKNSNE